jgi:outer membrane lipase/esterase
MTRKLFLAGVAVCALMSATSAQAQQFTRAIGFGDSLTDNGNIATANGGVVPNYLPLTLTRFSNGPVWFEQLFGSAGTFFTSPVPPNTGNIDYAFGGSRTTGAQTPGPTTQEQIGTFLLRGGQFGANDVVTLWAGANNIFQGLTVAAGNPATAAATMSGIATTAATDVGAQVRQLAAAGARTIVVANLPGFDTVPQFAGTTAAQLAGFSTSTFNSALASNLAAAAAASPGINIVTVDVAALFTAVQANPSAFGFANATQGCVTTPSCVSNPAAYNTFAFWDGVHPTQAGHALIAAAVRQYLIAPSRASMVATAFGETSLNMRRAAAISAFSTLDDMQTQVPTGSATMTKGGARPVTPSGQWHYFVNLTGEFGQSNGSFQNGILASSGVTNARAYDYKTGGLRVGAIRDFGGGWTGGAAFQVAGGTVDGGKARFEANLLNFSGDIFARWTSQQGYFVKLGLGFGLDRFSKYTYDTVGPLQNTGEALGYSASLMAEAGYDFRMGQLTLTPAARLGYIHGKLGAFNEAGIVAPVAYSARTTDTLLGAAELRFAYMMSPSTKLSAMVGYEDYFASNVKGTGRILGNTALPFSIAGRDPVGSGFIFGAGVDMNVGTWTAKISYRGSVGKDQTVRHSGTIGAGFRF